MKMQLEGTRFGDVNYEEDRVLDFPQGILGFPNHHRFLMLPHPGGGPFAWLQSVDEPSLAFPVIDPTLIRPDYLPPVRREDLERLGLAALNEGIFLAICVIPEDPQEMRANLLAPVVVNPSRRLGTQVVLENTDYQVRHYILQELAARTPKKEEAQAAAAGL